MPSTAAYAVIEVHFEFRYGRLHVRSEDVPGLYLCGPDTEKVMDDIIPAIKALFKLNRGWDVEVVPETEISEFPEARSRLGIPIAQKRGRLIAYHHAA